MTARGLPDGAAQNAVNTRLLSGDLESWRDYDLEFDPPKSGTINTIHLMDDQYWLHWTEDELGEDAINVDVARGPVSGDTTERTYFTGTDAPRVTNIELATTGGGQEYPINSYLLGVPAPEDAPTLAVSTGADDPESVTLTNPGAESNSTVGWTVTEGDLDVHEDGDVIGFDAYEGDYYFFGGAAAAETEAYQELEFSITDIAIGTEMVLTWHQASGANGSLAGMRLDFYDSEDDPVGSVASDVIAVSPSLTWEERSISTIVPSDADKVRVVMRFERVGGGENDAYIDSITLNVAEFSESYDGTTFGDWTKGPTGGSTQITIDATTGRDAPSWRFQQNNTHSYIYKNYSLDDVSAASISLTLRPSQEIHVFIGTSSAGQGTSFGFRSNGVRVYSHSSWTNSGTSGTSLTSTNMVDKWIRVTMEIESSGSSTMNVTLTVANDEDNSIYVDQAVIAVSTFGGILGFRSYSNSISEYSWVDNIAIAIPAPDPEDSNVTVFTNYVFTFVNAFNEESAPSPVSRTIQLNEDTSVLVTTPTTAPSGYGIDTKRIYRAVTGSASTEYQLVAEIPLATADYTDTKTDEELGEVLQTVDWDLPPDDMQGILALPNGIMMGFSKNQVCPSVQNYPHAYPELYRLNTDTPIVAIGAMDTSVVVATESNPYLVIGSDPSALSMSKYEQRQSCVSKRSMIAIQGYGVVYASPDGLVAVSGAGQLSVVTDNIFSRKEWQAISPETIIAVVHDDKYFGFYNNGTPGGFMFDPFANGNGFTWLNFYSQCGFSNPLDDKLYLVVSNIIQEWEKDTDKRAYTWKSKLFLLPRPASFRAAQVKAADYTSLTLRVDVDGTAVYNAAVTSATEFVLAAKAGNTLEVTVTGTSRVYSIEVAEDMDELEG